MTTELDRKLRAELKRQYDTAMKDRVRVSAPTPSDYRPYDTHEQFAVGYMAYVNGQFGQWANRNDPHSVAAQAWDRGMDYGRALARWKGL